MSRTVLQPEWLLDGTGASPQEGHSVVLAGGMIEQIIPRADAAGLAAEEVIDLPGMTLLPGLINHHVHLVLPGDNTPFVPWIDLQTDATLALVAAHNIATSLKSGVTTVRDCGGRKRITLDLRDAWEAGLTGGARVVACGRTITITGGHTRHFGGEADGEDGVRRMVRHVVSQGADYVKVMAAGGGTPGSISQRPSFMARELTVLTETAHALGRTVTAHCIATESISNAVAAGVDHIEHASFMGTDLAPNFDRQIAEDLAASGIPVTPTLQVSRDLVDMLPAGPERDLWQARQQAQHGIIGTLRELGVPLLAGSDAGWRATPFDTFWKELDELVACGLSPLEAIHAATGAAADALGAGDRYGSIKPDRLADLVAVDGNAAADIKALASVRAVFQAGELVHATLSTRRRNR